MDEFKIDLYLNGYLLKGDKEQFESIDNKTTKESNNNSSTYFFQSKDDKADGLLNIYQNASSLKVLNYNILDKNLDINLKLKDSVKFKNTLSLTKNNTFNFKTPLL